MFMKCKKKRLKRLKKNAKFCCLHFTKLQFLKKLSPLVHFGFSFLLEWSLALSIKLFKKIYRKMKSANFNM